MTSILWLSWNLWIKFYLKLCFLFKIPRVLAKLRFFKVNVQLKKKLFLQCWILALPRSSLYLMFFFCFVNMWGWNFGYQGHFSGDWVTRENIACYFVMEWKAVTNIIVVNCLISSTFKESFVKSRSKSFIRMKGVFCFLNQFVLWLFME